MGIKTILIILVIVVLMEDSASIKKTEEEKREEKELAEMVNKTLAEEKKKEEEEKKKGRLDPVKKKDEKEEKVGTRDETGDEDKDVKGKDRDEACPPLNFTCPTVEPCDPCPEVKECPKVKECGPCPTIKPCKPCGPCPVANITAQPPSISGCPEAGEASMTVPVAIAVGAAATLLLTGVATGLGLLLRYVPATVSGFLLLAIIIIIWYLCSHYPEAARDLGGRAATILREAAVALGHRVMAALQRHEEQVSFPVNSNLFL
jgi:hypothetical protein